MNKIVVTRHLPIEVEDCFKSYSLYYNKSSAPFSYDNFVREIEDADGLISMLSDNIDKNLLKNARKLKVVANYAAGFNNIDVDYCSEIGIKVCNTPHVLTEATAELGVALTISASRRIVEADKYVRAGCFNGWDPMLFLGSGLSGKTFGVYGFGKIGQTMAGMMKPFKMNVIYNSRQRKRHEENLLDAHFVSFEDLLRLSDVLVVAAPFNSTTKHRFTIKEFEKMKSSAVFVNIGRGEIVKESDLIKSLKNGEIAYAGLDVYEFEPEVSKDFYQMENVILLPHIGSATSETRQNMAHLCVQSVKEVLENNKLPWNIVNGKFFVDKQSN